MHGTLQKEAVSRWREAIRSGELGPAEAEAFKGRMGVDPAREATGLMKGWRGQAKAHGYKPFTLTPVNMASSAIQHKLKGGHPAAEAVRKFLRKRTSPVIPVKRLEEQMAHAAAGGTVSPGAVHPGLKTTSAFPAMELPVLAGTSKRHVPRYLASPSFRKQYRAAMMGHEGSEIAAMARSKFPEKLFRVPSPGLRPYTSAFAGGAGTNLAQRLAPSETGAALSRQMIMEGPYGGVLAGMHKSPRVLLEEVRNTRMLSPEVQEAMHNLRKATGEYQMMQNAGAQRYIPRRGAELRGMERGMEEAAGARYKDVGKMFDVAAKSPSAGLKRLISKILGRGRG